jgi:hypothetical protein
MTKIIYPLHVEDVPLFAKIQDAMKTVASNYRLRLTSIEPMTMPATGMADRLGECSHDGRIRLVLRCTVNGEWCDAPMSPDEVWDTAAHELAHLRFFDHSTVTQSSRLNSWPRSATRRSPKITATRSSAS